MPYDAEHAVAVSYLEDFAFVIRNCTQPGMSIVQAHTLDNLN